MIYPTTYDDLIRKAMADHLPMLDWRWGKAQLIAESNLDPNARSPVGAMGLAQFMPDTWGDAREANGWPLIASPFDPWYAIEGYGWYMRKLWGQWSSPRPQADRLKLTQASYNAGLGNILKAQRLARQPGEFSAPVDYDTIIAALPQVTGEHAQETINYVRRIAAIYSGLVTNP